MASKTLTTSTQQAQVLDSTRFDWAFIGVSSWLLGGLFADAWAHNHLPIDNFFTPWHGLLYTGLLSVIVLLTSTLILNMRKGYSWRFCVPAGYELSVIGMILFFCSGVGDLIWHTLFGIELNIDGALSPTHLGIVISSGLIVAGPFRALWRRPDSQTRQTFLGLLPMLLSLTYILLTINTLGQIFSPVLFLWPAESQQNPFGNQSLAVVSMLFQTIILMGWVLLTVKRWRLPFGSLTLVLTLNGILLSLMRDHYWMILVALGAGIIADLLVWQLQPTPKRPDSFRLFAFLVPVAFYLLYFLTLLLTAHVNWTIHLWLGTVFATGIAGFLLSYLLIPPEIPAEETL